MTTQKLLKDLIDQNDVVLFMKGTKEMPLCGFSSVVAQILKILNVSFKDVNVLDDMDIREGIKTYSNWPTIPQLYIKQEFIGGCDIVKEMYETKELHTLFTEKGLLKHQ
ncbi:MAG TPA: Grx4 family monothiol glutaredoxin [Alphaproteobacteria bacterium]|nr:Grx4 family monothiol glutaredoxin [Alphaproteobacteria bacterium]